ncbi:MAG: HlyD family efflux transporter periplasmic adaptor subunit [Pseudomonadota bacterium]
MQLNWKLALAGLPVLLGAGYLLFSGPGDRPVPEGVTSGNGRIEAVQVDVSTKIAGRVEAVLRNEGDLVRPGDVLAKIDSAQLRAQLSKAEAEIASAKSQVAEAQANVVQVESQLKLAERELERAARLVKQGHTSQETYDTRLSQRDVAKASLAAAKAIVVSRERAVDAAVAARAELQTQIDDSTLVSPTVGRVLYRLAEPGEVVTSGGKIVTLVNLADVYMEIFLPATDAHRLAIGSEARIVIDGTDFAVPAHVSFVSPEAQFTPKQVETASERQKLMFRVKVRVPPELVERHIDFVKTGIRGVAYVRPGFDPPDWPAWLERRFVPPPANDSEAAS